MFDSEEYRAKLNKGNAIFYKVALFYIGMILIVYGAHVPWTSAIIVSIAVIVNY